MSIVKASINELESLTELFDLYRVFYKQSSDQASAREFVKERLKNDESVAFIAYDDNDPVGFVQLYPSFSSVSMKRTWLLNDLYVKEKARGKGFGEKLIKKAITFADLLFFNINTVYIDSESLFMQ
jgi:GNAT superfamily N-acetyltransferase